MLDCTPAAFAHALFRADRCGVIVVRRPRPLCWLASRGGSSCMLHAACLARPAPLRLCAVRLMPMRYACGRGKIATRLTMRALSFAFLAAFLMATDASAQTAQLAPIPMPLPFPQGSSVFQWDYECVGQKGCGFTGFGLERLSLKSASIVLARFKVGEIEMPTYFIWGTLIDGSPVSAMDQNEFSFRFSAVNMRLIAAGPPGL